MPVRTLTIAALSSFLLAAPALADRTGDAPVKAPQNLKTDHVEFTLPGSGWLQLVGALAGTPAYGRYALETKLPNGSICNPTVEVVAVPSARPPIVSARTVRLRPLSRFAPVIHVTSRGRHGAIQWWAGTADNTAAAAGGFQRLPARLATKAHPYLVYTVVMQHASVPRREPRCHAAEKAARIARTIARTMHLAPGPPVARPPFTS
jgi:hypothetical protein